jgi:hypothetical protein
MTQPADLQPNHPLNDPASQDDDKLKNDQNVLNDQRPVLGDSDLFDIFGITGTDLNANRMGRFSPVQKESLEANLKQEVDGMWLLLTIFLGMSVFIALILFPAGDMTPYMIAGIGIILVAFVFFSYRRQNRARSLADSQRVKSVAGVPQLSATRFGANPHMRVGDKVLSITPQQFMQLARYALPYMKVYYTQNGDQVVSAEILRRYNDDEKLKNDLEDSVPDVLEIPEDFIDDAAHRDDAARSRRA